MKTIVILFIGLLSAANAQYVVTDPISDALGEIQHVEDIAKAVEMISNQVEQINTLTQQLQQIRAYVDAFGNPDSLKSIVGADSLTQSLNTTGLGQSLGELRGLSSGTESMRYNGDGIFQTVGTSFTTPSGESQTRDEELYRKFGALDQTSTNYQSVYDDVNQRRQALRQQISQTTQQLQSASTDAETQKLTGVLTGYNAELSAVDHELEQAFTSVVVQDAENRADTEKQQQARREERKAEFSEALKNYSQIFTLDASPAQFPGR